MKMVQYMCVLAVIVLPFQAARADIVSPPPWRGSDGSTFQEWNFETDANSAAPSSLANIYGIPSALINTNELATGWWDTLPEIYGSKQGWWDVATGSITLTVPQNPTPAPGSILELQIGIISWVDLNGLPELSLGPSATLVTNAINLVESGPVGGGWYSSLSLWHIEPSPSALNLVIYGHATKGSQIDQVTVDTHVIPEPSTIMLSLVALPLLLRTVFRRKQQ